MGSMIGTIQQTMVNMDGPKAKFVMETIQSEKVVIFSKSYCPFSLMAKEQFKKLNYPYFAIELDKRDDADEIQEILKEITGAKTVPRVFIDGKFVGGGADIKKMYENGTLQKLLCIN